MQKISKTTKDTEQIAKNFVKSICVSKNASIVCLFGDLGTGKTTFSKYLAEELGVKRKVNSPTFVLMKKYEIKNKIKNSNLKKLIHIDAYRLKSEKEILSLGWKEIIANPENLILIEWPENIKKVLPKKHHKIEISHTKEGHRKFKINKK